MRPRTMRSAGTKPGGAGRRPRPSGATVLVVVCVLAATACGSSPHPVTLADGSTAARIPAALRHHAPRAVLTRERTVPARALDDRGRACVALTTGRAPAPAQMFTERVDHYGSSLTFRPAGGRFVIGCTSGVYTPGAKGSRGNAAWCGHVVGEIRAGHLVDPRLDIACRTASGAPIGSAWIEPVVKAKWIFVRGHALTQIYPTAGSLPVRVTTLAADLPTATAVFRVEQYDAEGTRVSEETLRTAVAG